ncbi:Bone morphogenetic protein receptor type IB precursor, putative [Entamoeba dispar SAW760]|uniref:Bone morphogenetic protein receptor type IB, putative n=1 Tax=Entamoeba dispar (strain ATCC PRA-260 / SAW760) TaxID=370354 RepID=B0E907_ENTDS|nr:Bone morphogenetic protein receptor type IB precursor, putative [Entamoeba dispar SAW760]EDR28980.1 Bone morphogenetic protein receptor type IB precursor, putative [Entamoeba dispar SAW760]|eukprot:EDR28980.1 Bone morphogenetic protein receptor type IB precursor, putative [Entamoeba dispar SAW760]
MFKKTKLINIVRNETADKVKEYLNKKKVDKKTFEKFKTKEENPLYVSMIIRKDFEMSQELIKVMIKVKADINKYDEAEQTILHYVCNTFTSDASFIMALLQFPGINVNAKNRDEQTPLHIFCNHFANVQSYKTVLQKFVELHAEIDATNSYLETPLIKTVKNQKLRGLIVQFLIDNGANINVANKAKILHYIFVGLGVLHNNKPSILHRDFKSLNVLVTNDYTLKISDFGMSRFDTTENREKDLKELSGTIPYCSPEIIPSDGHSGLYTTKSDIYSLGIVFWEIFRRVVFGSYTKPWFKEYNIPSANDFAILNLITAGKRPTLEIKEYNEACKNYVPPSVHQLYYSCVDEEPDKRPNAEELIKMIDSMKQEYIHNNNIWNKYYVPVGYKKM